MNRLLILLIVLAGAAPAPAAAQRIDSPYRFLDHGQFVGVYAGQVFADEGVLRAGPQPAPTFGARWALRVTGPFSVGVELGYTPTTRTVRDTTFEPGDSVYTAIGEADMKLISLMANLRFSLTGPRTWNALQPYLLFGAGAVVDVAGRSALETDLPPDARFNYGTSFAGQLGAGVEWFPSSRISLRLDGRNALWKLEVPEAFILTERGRTLPRSAWEQNFVAAAGVSFHF